jgi:hypothetical protein
VFDAPPRVDSSGSSGGGEEVAAAVAAAFAAIQGLCEGIGGDLPPGWLSAVDPESGDTYYYDTFTHKTTWFKPYKASVGHHGAADGAAAATAEGTAGGTSGARGQGAAGGDGGAATPAQQSDRDRQPSGRSGEKGEFGAFEGFGRSSPCAFGDEFGEQDETSEEEAGSGDEEVIEEDEEVIEFGAASSQQAALLAAPFSSAAIAELMQGAEAEQSTFAADAESDEEEEIPLSKLAASKWPAPEDPSRSAVSAHAGACGVAAFCMRGKRSLRGLVLPFLDVWLLARCVFRESG